MSRRSRIHSRARRQQTVADLRQELQAQQAAHTQLSAFVANVVAQRNMWRDKCNAMAAGHAQELKDEREKSHYARRFFDRLTGMLANTCMALDIDPAKYRHIRHAVRSNQFSVKVLTYSGAYRPAGLLDDIPAMVRCEQEAMHLLQISSVHESLARQMHVRVTLENACAGYAISQEAIKLLPAEDLATTIADELAVHLVSNLRHKHDGAPWDPRPWLDERPKFPRW